jgi:hypothetical protein
MTYPTISEMARMTELPRDIQAAVEFAWAFTQWWELLEKDDELPGDPDKLREMELAHQRWQHAR